MIIDCVLTACNEKPLYIDFIPMYIHFWKKLYPTIDIKIILIMNEIPKKLKDYQQYIILFKPIPNINTGFISQYIRNLYPSILKYKNGVLITDIDIFPMNSSYFTKSIEKYDNNKFIYYRGNFGKKQKQIAMCYNVASPKTWSCIFQIYSLNDIIERLKKINNNNKIIDGSSKAGWFLDQIDLYKNVHDWNKKTNNYIELNDNLLNYQRLKRIEFKLTDDVKEKIKNGFYCDYHGLRPYNNYKEIYETIINIL
jgi:hypothetical protein